MSLLQATGFSKDSPKALIERFIIIELTKVIKASPPKTWSSDDRHVALACIKYLVYGTESPKAALHTVHDRFNHLSEAQSDWLFWLCHLADWDEPFFVVRPARTTLP